MRAEVEMVDPTALKPGSVTHTSGGGSAAGEVFEYDPRPMTEDKQRQPSAVGVRYVDIDEHRAGQRLDNFLLGQLKGVPKSHVYRLLRRGEVRVNRGRAGPEYRLQPGDSVRLPPVRMTPPTTVAPDRDYRWLAERILYEDDAFLALDKPAGIAVHAGSGVSTGVIEALRAVRPQEPFLELVHRLDRSTSGCLLLAKTRPALLAFHDMLKRGGIDKRYLALVKGPWRGGPTEVEAPLTHHRRSGERVVGVAEDGKLAETRFVPKGTYGPVTLVEIHLLTGRMHQARVHAAHVGHPIAGDDKYGDRKLNRRLRPLGLRRLFLHAAAVRLKHPLQDRRLALEAPLPPELATVLERLRRG